MIGGDIGPYRVLSKIGSGGMGTVWRCRVEGDAAGGTAGDEVAVKVVHPHLLETPGFFKRFLREAEIGMAVRHENVVRTFDADAILREGQHHHYLVMECVEGQTLRGLLEELGRVPEELCLHIGREVARGLEAIHAAGVVHRDLKPENVLITAEQSVKIMDLGVARLADEVIRLSQTGVFVGSVHYAAPEQFHGGGRELDGRADLYALGLTLYELATGEHPYGDRDVRVSIRKKLTEDLRPAGALNPQLSPFFEELLGSLTVRERADRFASATELEKVCRQGEESEWWRGRVRSIRARTDMPLRRVRVPRETEIFGREAELARLHDLYESARAGAGRVALVSGEAGIGKSRLVDELVAGLRDEGEEIHFLFGSYPPAAASASSAFATAYREHFGAQDLEKTLSAYMGSVSGLTTAFAAMLRGEAAPEGSEPVSLDSLRLVFDEVTGRLAEERTTVILIDDLHFAPEEGLGLFASLCRAAEGRRLLVIGTHRPGLSERWLADLQAQVRTARIDLTRLGSSEVSALLADALRSERLASQLAGRIVRKADGNPFFVFEILRGLKEREILKQRADGVWVTDSEIGEIRVPSSVLDLIEARVKELVSEERDLLDAAACCGFEFDPLLVAEALEEPRIRVLKHFARIEERHGLVRAVGRRYVFDHHQVQETLYERLPPSLRESYHLALGEALDRRPYDPKTRLKTGWELRGDTAVELTEHFLRGGAPVRAERFLANALAHLQHTNRYDAYLDLMDRTVMRGGPLFDRHWGIFGGEWAYMHDLIHRAEAEEHLGRREEARGSLTEARAISERLESPEDAGTVLVFLGRHLAIADRHDEAEQVAGRLSALAAEIGEPWLDAAARGILADIHLDTGRTGEALADAEAYVSLSRKVGAKRDEVDALGYCGLVRTRLGDHEGAGRCLDDALALVRRIRGDRARILEGRILTRMGDLRLQEARPEPAEERFGEALDVFRSAANRPGLAAAHLGLGRLHVGAGRKEFALRHLAESASMAWEIAAESVLAVAGALRATLGENPRPAVEVLLEGGDAIPIWERLEANFHLFKATGDRDHLRAAAALLAHAEAQAPPEHRATLLDGVPLHREIRAAAYPR